MSCQQHQASHVIRVHPSCHFGPFVSCLPLPSLRNALSFFWGSLSKSRNDNHETTRIMVEEAVRLQSLWTWESRTQNIEQTEKRDYWVFVSLFKRRTHIRLWFWIVCTVSGKESVNNSLSTWTRVVFRFINAIFVRYLLRLIPIPWRSIFVCFSKICISLSFLLSASTSLSVFSWLVSPRMTRLLLILLLPTSFSVSFVIISSLRRDNVF